MNFFYSPNLDNEQTILTGDEFRHCTKSLRLGEGDLIHLVDGKGTKVVGMIHQVTKREVIVNIHDREEQYNTLPFQTHLAVAPTKNRSRFEWMAEKCTEIGISSLTPILCEHSERSHFKTDRIEKIMISAMKQSLKATLPIINEPINFTTYLNASYHTFDEKFICTGEAKDHLYSVYQSQPNLSILVGPEGDFSPQELDFAKELGYSAVHLGSQRLRTETAGVVACATIGAKMSSE